MKSNFRKIIAFLLVIAMSMLGSACDKKDGGDKKDGLYRASAVTSDLSMADDVTKFLDKVDAEYGYKLTTKLAYDENLSGHLGWRLAGSDEEHVCADFLFNEMKKIGLSDVEKVAVSCDRFQFNDSKLKIEGTDIDLTPASYQCNGTGAGGIRAEIVDCGTGTFADYANVDVKGKIALVGVDQWNESWIDGYIRQADEAGAIALVTYSAGGYGTLNADVVNVQDICAPDLMPTAAISPNEAEKIQKAIKNGHKNAYLMLDARMETGKGTSYNIVGKIPGKNREQQIVLSGHYDKYWYGFQDDCAAIGLVYTVAKAMIDSGYEPENDIVFVAHGAEEWGKSNSAFDWTTGAWGMIHDAKPEWGGKTLALLNCELPAFVPQDGLSIGGVPEWRTVIDKLINHSGLLVTSGDVGINRKGFDSSTMEDGVSYRWHGVPYFINFFEDEKFLSERYHTIADDKSTYDEDIFTTNINWYGALATYIDQTPALELDLEQAAEDLGNNYNKEYARSAEIDSELYLKKIKEFKTLAAKHNEKIKSINEEYERAVKEEDFDRAEALKIDGRELNKQTLEIFAYLQKHYLKNNDFEIFYGHKSLYDNLDALKGAIEALKRQELWSGDEDGALDFALKLNALHDYNYILYSKTVGDAVNRMYDPRHLSISKDTWGFDRQLPVVYVGDITHMLANSGDNEPDWEQAIDAYTKACDQVLVDIKSVVNEELAAFDGLFLLF